jgi:hypothetical protein
MGQPLGECIKVGLFRFAALLGLTLSSQVMAQNATVRLDLTDYDRAVAMRPEEFTVERTAVVPLSGNLDSPRGLGEFLTRYGKNPRQLEPKLGINGRYHERVSTWASAVTNGSTLRLTVLAEEPHPELMGHEISSIYYVDDRIEVQLDLNHDHHDFFVLTVWPDGRSQVESYRVKENHLSYDRRFIPQERELTVDTRTVVEPPGWRFIADIGLGDLFAGGGAWRVIGLNIVRHRGVGGEETTMWCPDYKRVDAPLYLGDLYLGKPAAVVQSVRLGTVCWGENYGRFEASKGAEALLAINSYNYKGLWKTVKVPVLNGVCDFGYEIDPHEMMHSSLELVLDGVRWGSYEFGWKRSILLTHRPAGGYTAPRPEAGADDYYWKYCRYILDRLPRFKRSSDGLTLCAEGITEIDLRRMDALERLAAIISERFTTTEDRITAATLLLCQQGLMVSSGTGAKLTMQEGGLGSLRVGAAFCDAYGELLRDLLNRLCDERGNPLRAVVVNFVPGEVNTFGWPHHWCAGVAYRGGITIVDSELGVVYVNPEEGRLATLQELLDHPELAGLSSYGLHQYFDGRELRDFKVREAGNFWEKK